MSRRFSATVDSRGRITLPLELRQALGIQSGDRVEFELVGGTIRIFRQHHTVKPVFASVPALPYDYVEGDPERIAKEEKSADYIRGFGLS